VAAFGNRENPDAIHRNRDVCPGLLDCRPYDDGGTLAATLPPISCEEIRIVIEMILVAPWWRPSSLNRDRRNSGSLQSPLDLLASCLDQRKERARILILCITFDLGLRDSRFNSPANGLAGKGRDGCLKDALIRRIEFDSTRPECKTRKSRGVGNRYGFPSFTNVRRHPKDISNRITFA
jgi:hypothetical protein